MTVNLGFDQEQLEGLIGAVKSDPEAGKTVWRATSQWQRGFRSKAIIPREGRSLTVEMDEPAGLGGSDTAPNMVEIVLGAYGCCLTTGYVMNAALAGIELEGVEIEVDGDLDLQGFFSLRDPNEVWPGFTEVRAKVALKAPKATPEQLEELHGRVARTSPVGSILERPVTVRAELA